MIGRTLFSIAFAVFYSIVPQVSQAQLSQTYQIYCVNYFYGPAGTVPSDGSGTVCATDLTVRFYNTQTGKSELFSAFIPVPNPSDVVRRSSSATSSYTLERLFSGTEEELLAVLSYNGQAPGAHHQFGQVEGWSNNSGGVIHEQVGGKCTLATSTLNQSSTFSNSYYEGTGPILAPRSIVKYNYHSCTAN